MCLAVVIVIVLVIVVLAYCDIIGTRGGGVKALKYRIALKYIGIPSEDQFKTKQNASICDWVQM